MFDMLAAYLSGKVSAERLALYGLCYDNLNKLEVPQFDQILDEIMMSEFDGISDINTAIDKIDVFFNVALHEVMKQHGVTLNEDTPLYLTNLMVSGILDLAEYENTEEVDKSLNLHLSNEETFCELLHLVISKTVDELLPYIEEVDINLFKRISLHIQSKEEITASIGKDSTVSREFRIKAIQQLINHTQNYNLAIINVLGSGMDVGYTYTVYVDAIRETFNTDDPDSIADNLYGCALVSSDGFENPRETILSTLDDYIPDLDVETKINIRLTFLAATVKI